MDERGVTPAEGGTRSTDSGDADREEGHSQAPGLGMDALRGTGSDRDDHQGNVTNRSVFVEHLQPRSDRDGAASTASTSRRVRRQCFRHRTSAVTVATSAFFSSSALAFYLVRRYHMHNESSPDLCESYDSWVQSGVSVLACWILYESCLAISMRIAPLYHLDSGRTPLRYINRVVRMSCAAYLVSSCFSVLIEKSSRSEPFPQLVCSLPALFAIHSGAFSVYLLMGILSSCTTRSERLVPLSFVLLDVLEYVSLSDAAAPRVFVPIRCLLAVATTACCSAPGGTCAGETTRSGAPTATPPGESEIPRTHAVRGYDPTRPPNRILVTSVVFAFCSSQFVHALPCSVYGECSDTRVARFVSTRIVVLLCVCTVNLFELIAGSVVRSYEELRHASSKIDREKKMIMRYIFHEIRGPLNEISIILDACSRVVPHREEPGNESEPPGPMSNRSAGSSHMRIGSYMLCASPMTAALPSGEGEAYDIEYRISGNEATILSSALSRTSEILAESSLLHSFHNKESNVGSAVFRPRKMLEDIARLYEYQFGVKKIGFSHRFKSELGDVFLRGDAALIRIVVCNYVNRAVQCTPQRGNVRIDIRVYNRGRKRWVKTPTSRVHPTAANGSPNAANVAALLVEVADDGYGFKKEDSEAIFEPFSSVATGGNDAVYSGYGMGLAICKSIAAALGGTVEAHSDGQGRGACFKLRVEGLQYFTLAEMESGSVRSRVELEDSNYGNSIRVSSTRTDPISSYEHRHLSVTTEEAPTRAGAETVGRESEAIDTRVYMMDTINGRTEGLSSGGAHREAVAGGTSTDHSAVSEKVRRRISTQNVGMRIQIPPQSTRLPQLEEKPGGAAPEGGGRAWDVVMNGMDVVLVEDSITTMSALKRLVRNMGARNTECCADGSIAVKSYEKAVLSGRVFDLFITDLNMPNMGGIEMTSLLRGRGYIGPIIGVSAHAIEEDKSKMLESGMDVVLSKPINKSILSSACRLAIEQASARGFAFSDLCETAVSSESCVCSQSGSGGTRVQDDPEASKGVGGDIAARGAVTCFPSGMRRGELERSVTGRTDRFICAREPVSHSSHGCSGGLGHQETGRVYSKKRLPPLSGPSSSCSMLVPATVRETAMRSVTAIDHLPATPSSPSPVRTTADYVGQHSHDTA